MRLYTGAILHEEDGNRAEIYAPDGRSVRSERAFEFLAVPFNSNTRYKVGG